MHCVRGDCFSRAQPLRFLSPGIIVGVHQHPPRQALTGHLATWPARLSEAAVTLGLPAGCLELPSSPLLPTLIWGG